MKIETDQITYIPASEAWWEHVADEAIANIHLPKWWRVVEGFNAMSHDIYHGYDHYFLESIGVQTNFY